MSVLRSKFITITSKDSKTNSSNTNLFAKFGNQSFKLYSGFAFSHISFINNFYNVTSKTNTLKVYISDILTPIESINERTILIEPGYYFIDDLASVIKTKVLALMPPLSMIDIKVGYFDSIKLETVNFGIKPYNVDSSSTLSKLLGFVNSTWITSVNSESKNGYYFASHENSLYSKNKNVFLHSQVLKLTSTYNGSGEASNVVASIPVIGDIGDTVHFTDSDAGNVHHIFSNKREVTEIDLQFKNSNNEDLECSYNDVVVSLRLFN